MNEEVKKAIDLVKQVCADFNGKLQQHQAIQNALKTIEDNLKEDKKA